MHHGDLTSTRSHIEHGIKTGLASVLAYVGAELLNLPYAYWASLSAVIVMQMSVADSIRMCWYRFSGTAVGAVIAAIAILALPDTHAWTIVGLFLSIGFCAYMTRYNVRYKMAAITTCIVYLASMGEPGRLIFGMERVLEIGLGVSCAFLVSVVVLPQRAGVALRTRLEEQFTRLARHYGEVIDAFLHRQSDLEPTLLDPLVNDALANRALFQGTLRHERLIYRDDTRALGMQLNTLETCLALLKAMLRSLNDDQDQGYDILMEPELRSLTTAIQETLNAIGQGHSPDTTPLAQALDTAHARLSELRDSGVTKRFSLQMLMKFFSFYHQQRFLARMLLQHGELVRKAEGKE